MAFGVGLYHSGASTPYCTIKRLTHNEQLMGEDYVTVSYESPTVDGMFLVGDYLTYRGVKYVIDVPPTLQKQARVRSKGNAFVFDSVKLTNEMCFVMSYVEFRDVVNGTEHYNFATRTFSFYAETLKKFGERLKANLDRDFPDKFNIYIHYQDGSDHLVTESVSGTKPVGKDNIVVNISDEKCWNALAHVKDDFDVNFVMRSDGSKMSLYLGANGRFLSQKNFSYGKGNGLFKIERTTDESQAITTVLRAYGDEKNMPTRYYKNVGVRCYMDITNNTNGVVRDYAYWLYFKSDGTNGGRLYPTSFKDPIDLEGIFVRLLKTYIPDVTQPNYWYVVNVYGAVVSESGTIKKGKNKVNALIGVHEGLAFMHIRKTAGSTDSQCQAFWNEFTKSGFNRLYVEDGACKNKWPSAWTVANSNCLIPNNINVKCLMLPGYGFTSLYDTVEATFDDGRAASIRVLQDFDSFSDFCDKYTLSKDACDPWISPTVQLQKYGKREGCVVFDDSNEKYDPIYPSLQYLGGGKNKLPSQLDNNLKADDGVVDTDNTGVWFLYVLDPGFNPYKCRTDGSSTFKVSFKDGMLGGREFDCSAASPVEIGTEKGYRLTLNRIEDDSLDLVFPYVSKTNENLSFVAKRGDEFVYLDIDMPSTYIEQAALYYLLPAALETLDDVCDVQYKFNLTIDEVEMARQHDYAVSTGSVSSLHDTIRAGDIMLFSDDDLDFSNLGESSEDAMKASIFIDSIEIQENESAIPRYTVNLVQTKTVTTIQRIEKKIDAISTGVVNYSGGAELSPDTWTSENEFSSTLALSSNLGWYLYERIENSLMMKLWGNVVESGGETYGSILMKNQDDEEKQITLEVDEEGNLHITGNVYADGFVSAFGKNEDESGSGYGSLFDLVQYGQWDVSSWSEDKAANAKDVYERITALEGRAPETDWIKIESKTIHLGDEVSLTDIGIPSWAQDAALQFSSLPSMFWANLPVSETSNDQTIPTFKSVVLKNGDNTATIELDEKGNIRVNKAFYSNSWVSAFGENEDSTGAGDFNLAQYGQWNAGNWSYDKAANAKEVYERIVALEDKTLETDWININTKTIHLGDTASLTDIGIPSWAQKTNLEFVDLPELWWGSVKVASVENKGTSPYFKDIRLLNNGKEVHIYVDDEGNLAVDKAFYSESWVSAFGKNGEPSGVGSFDLAQTNKWNSSEWTSDKAANAKDVFDKITALESKTLEVDWIKINTKTIHLGDTATLSDIGIPTWAQSDSLQFSSLPKMCWANLPIQSTESETTVPTFQSVKIKVGNNVAVLTLDGEGNLKVDKAFYSDSWVSAFGKNTTSTEGSFDLSPSSWTVIGDFGSTKALAANLGWDLYDRISNFTGSIKLGNATMELGGTYTLTQIGIPTWAQSANKPSYAFSEITGKATFAQLPSLYWADQLITESAKTDCTPTVKSITLSDGTKSVLITLDGGDVKVNGNLFATGWISAFGKNTNADSGCVSLSPTSWTSPKASFTNALALASNLGYDLYERVAALEANPGGVTTFGGQKGDITVKKSTTTNGDVYFVMSSKMLTAKVYGLGTAAYTSSSDYTSASHATNTSNPHSVTKAQVGLGNVENTALSTWAGSTSITTLGTITTGTWQGTKIANAYLANSKMTLWGNEVELGGSTCGTITIKCPTNANKQVQLSVDTEGYLHVIGGGLYSDGFVSAFGKNADASSGGADLSATSWTTSSAFPSTKALASNLGWDLNARVAALEANPGGVTSVGSKTGDISLSSETTSGWIKFSMSGNTIKGQLNDDIYVQSTKIADAVAPSIPTDYIKGSGITSTNFTTTSTSVSVLLRYNSTNYTLGSVPAATSSNAGVMTIEQLALLNSHTTQLANKADLSSLKFSALSGTAAFSQLPALYWANVQVGSSADVTTNPVMATITTTGKATVNALQVGTTSLLTGNVTAKNNVTVEKYLYVGTQRWFEYDATNDAIKLNGNFYATGFVSAFGRDGNSTGSDDLAIKGALTVGTSSTNATISLITNDSEDECTIVNSGGNLTVNAATAFRTSSNFMPTENGTINSGGSSNRWKAVYCVNASNSTSDIRLKDVLGDVSLSMDSIANAPLFSFKWKNEEWGDETHIGSSAQYWMDVLPESVITNEDGTLGLTYDYVNTAGMISIARNVISIQDKIKALENEIEQLKRQIA